MTIADSPIPRFHLAMPVDDLTAARHFYGEVLGLEQGRSSETWVDWNLRGHQFVTHLAPARAQQVRAIDLIVSRGADHEQGTRTDGRRNAARVKTVDELADPGFEPHLGRAGGAHRAVRRAAHVA
mgnify:CR=1 FL=1